MVAKVVTLFRQRPLAAPLGEQLKAAAGIGVLVFVASLVGVATRPAGFLAAIWPANALLLGLLVRRPATAKPLGWCAAALGYVAANLVGGTGYALALLLTIGNLAGVALGFMLFMRRDLTDRRLRRPKSVLHLVVIVVVAASASATVGPIVNPFLFGHSPADGWAYRFASELVNYVTILPLVLTMPAPSWMGLERRRNVESWRVGREKLAPALALAVSCLAGGVVGGPGALAFPVPALLWCATVYGQFATAVMTFLFSAWTTLAIAFGHLVEPEQLDTQYALMSARIGIALMALAPLTVASVMAARNALLDQLRQLAAHDPLTGALNRRAFVQSYREQRGRRKSRDQTLAVMVLDLDHFKRVNDTWGHAAGDEILVVFARTVRECLRGTDLLGRFGGEEFVVILYNCTGEEAENVAERVRAAVADMLVPVEGGRSVAVTVSIGVAAADEYPDTLDPLVADADRALYAAKAGGRDRVVRADASLRAMRAPSDTARAAAGR